MNTPAITFIVPTFNRSGLFLETLASVRAQSVDAWELIVVDDGSEPDELRRIRDAVDAMPSARLLQRSGTPRGACRCRNLGLEASQTEYAVFLDADDLVAPTCVERRLAAVERDPGQDFWIFPNRSFLREPQDTAAYKSFPEATDQTDLRRFFQMDGPWITTGVLWTRGLLQSLGGWGEGLPAWQDWDLNVRALLTHPRYARVAGFADCYWRRPSGASIGSTRHTPERLRSILSMVEERFREARQQNESGVCDDDLARIYVTFATKAVRSRLLPFARTCLRDARGLGTPVEIPSLTALVARRGFARLAHSGDPL